MAPGWQFSTSRIASSVLKRIAVARPFFRTAMLAGVTPEDQWVRAQMGEDQAISPSVR